MSTSTAFWYRNLFKVKLYESFGTSFQQLINNLFQYSVDDFQSIDPWGSWGDGGNDGWVPSKGHYYQVYGPKPNSSTSLSEIVNKAVDDFHKLPGKWSSVRAYYFVYNDRYMGAPAPIASSLQGLKEKYGLEDARVLAGSSLERMFMELSDVEKTFIVGGIPEGKPGFLDARCVGEVLSYLADESSSLPPLLDESAPDFCEKIQFNGLTVPVSDYLRSYQYQASIVDDFLVKREPGLMQSISEEVSKLYADSKTVVQSTQTGFANLRYVWMVEQLIPETMRQHPHSMKAYREAAQVVISKYFETCDVYEHPECASAA